MQRGPRWSQSEGAPYAHEAGGLSGPKAKDVPSPMRRGPRWSQNGGGSLAHAAGALVVPKRRRLPRLCAGGLGGP